MHLARDSRPTGYVSCFELTEYFDPRQLILQRRKALVFPCYASHKLSTSKNLGQCKQRTYHQHECPLQGTAAMKCRSISAHALLQPAPLPLPPRLAQRCGGLGQPGEPGARIGVEIELLGEGQGPAALHVLLLSCTAPPDLLLLHGKRLESHAVLSRFAIGNNGSLLRKLGKCALLVTSGFELTMGCGARCRFTCSRHGNSLILTALRQQPPLPPNAPSRLTQPT